MKRRKCRRWCWCATPGCLPGNSPHGKSSVDAVAGSATSVMSSDFPQSQHYLWQSGVFSRRSSAGLALGTTATVYKQLAGGD